jgi:hypothetical protein
MPRVTARNPSAATRRTKRRGKTRGIGSLERCALTTASSSERPRLGSGRADRPSPVVRQRSAPSHARPRCTSSPAPCTRSTSTGKFGARITEKPRCR